MEERNLELCVVFCICTTKSFPSVEDRWERSPARLHIHHVYQSLQKVGTFFGRTGRRWSCRRRLSSALSPESPRAGEAPTGERFLNEE